MNVLSFPIGVYEAPEVVSVAQRNEWIADIEALPKRMNDAVRNLTAEQLDTPYRPEGWTLRQTVHHTADSHQNAYIRFKLALTEDNPTIKPYEQDAWAMLEDSKLPIDLSLKILEGVHARWTVILKNMTDADFARTFVHPEHNKKFRLDIALGMYSWHSRHHTAHIEKLVARMRWQS